jgi:hypothetical protein
VEVGLYNEADELIQKERLLISEIINTITLITDQKVHAIRIDPDYLLFDVNRDNDVWVRGE